MKATKDSADYGRGPKRQKKSEGNESRATTKGKVN